MDFPADPSVVIARFALMPDPQQPHDRACGVESIQREIPGIAVGDHQFAQFTLDPATDERMIGENADRIRHTRKYFRGHVGCLLHQEFAQALKVTKRFGRIDYLRHLTGFGRFAGSPRTLAAT